jgi:hypothetical protein
MPNHIKLVLSLACLIAAAGGYWLMMHLGRTAPGYAVIFLGVFATIAMWVFPEVVTKDSIRRPGR